MKAYSIDLREKVLAAVDRGIPRRQVAHDFDIDLRTITRWLRLRHDTGTMTPRPKSGRPGLLKPQLAAGLTAQLRAAPDATIAEQCAAWEAATGQCVSPTTMRRAMTRLGWTRKKRV
jgi:transposase